MDKKELLSKQQKYNDKKSVPEYIKKYKGEGRLSDIIPPESEMRLMLLESVYFSGRCDTNKVAQDVQKMASNASRYLNEMHRAGNVVKEKESKKVYWKISDQGIELLEYMYEILDEEQRLQSLSDKIEDKTLGFGA